MISRCFCKLYLQAFRLLPLQQDEIEQLYARQAAKADFAKKRGVHVGGLGYGFNMLSTFGIFALAFWYGG